MEGENTTSVAGGPCDSLLDLYSGMADSRVSIIDIEDLTRVRNELSGKSRAFVIGGRNGWIVTRRGLCDPLAFRPPVEPREDEEKSGGEKENQVSSPSTGGSASHGFRLSSVSSWI